MSVEPITTELRALLSAKPKGDPCWDAMDAIDAVHAALEAENAELRAKLDEQGDSMHDGWVELPKDADGEYIRVGDVMASDSGTKGTVTSIAPNSIVLDHSSIGSNPKSFRHYHAPTVEDVTCEFLQDLSDWLGLSLDIDYIKADSLFAEYAQKLQLAKGGDE